VNLGRRQGHPTSPEIKSYIGPADFWRRTKAAILNSRQSKYPIGDDPWIKATVGAVKHVAHQENILLTSIGMNTWELTLATASELKMSIIVVLPGDPRENQSAQNDIVHRFRLDSERTGFAFMETSGGRGGKAGWLPRDAVIIREADILIPISIRPGGNLASALSRSPGKIHDEFLIPYRKSSRPRPKYETLAINPDLRDGEWLIHFTRSVPGPWPDETEFDYYRAVRRSGSAYCRSAKTTLHHMLETGVIHGSTRNIRCGRPVVGFTCFTRKHYQDLFRYRPRLVNPYFEPYGVAVRYEAAHELGIRPVRYGTPDLYNNLSASEKPLFQNVGSNGIRWKGESEWRFVGDFALADIPADMARVIVPTVSECETGRSKFGFAVLQLFCQNAAI